MECHRDRALALRAGLLRHVRDNAAQPRLAKRGQMWLLNMCSTGGEGGIRTHEGADKKQ